MRVSEGTRRDHPPTPSRCAQGRCPDSELTGVGVARAAEFRSPGRSPGRQRQLNDNSAHGLSQARWEPGPAAATVLSKGDVDTGGPGAAPGRPRALENPRGTSGLHCARPWEGWGTAPSTRAGNPGDVWGDGAGTRTPVPRGGRGRRPGDLLRTRGPWDSRVAAGAAPCDPRSHLPGRTGRAAAPWTARTLGEESRAAPRGGRWRCGCGSPAGGRACAGWAGHPLTLHGESSAPPLTARQAGAQGGRNRPRAPSHLQGVPGVRRGARRPMWRWWPRDTASLCLCRGGPAGTACPGRRVHGAGTREWNRPAARRGHTQREPRTGWGAPGNCTAELPVPHFPHGALTKLRVSPL